MLESDARLIRTFVAENWYGASKQKHQFFGWEPYEPMENL